MTPAPTSELVGLVAARTLSVLGDQLARVALSALVLDRTGSPLLAALTFAATFLPAVLGTALLGGLADRLPRRRLLVVGDLVRAALVLPLALPGVPVAVVLLLVLLVTTVDGPTGAARSALLRQLTGTGPGADDRYQRATAWDETCTQAGQVGGYLLGGVAVVAWGTTTALLLDAASFALSATLLLGLVRPREASDAGTPSPLRDLRTGLRAALGPGARLPVLLTWAVTATAVAPEALALAWAREVGLDAAAGGVLLAANPVGGVLGLLVLLRVRAATARQAMLPLVLLALVPLLAAPWTTSLPLMALLVLLSGSGLTLTTIARTAFSGVLDDAVRGRAFAVAGTGLIVGQGLGIAVAGVVAEVLGTPGAIAVCAAAGLLAAAAVVVLPAGGAVPASK